MPLHLEYHPRMRYWMPVFAVLLISVFTLSASAQANGVPPSVTSFGFGGHPGFNGPPPSVTSPGPLVAVPPQRVFHQPGFRSPDAGTHHRHNQNQGFAYPYYVPYYIPYSPLMDPNDAAVGDESAADAPEDPNQYQGGPTIFDRRGSGAASYIPPVKNVPRPRAFQSDVSAVDPDPPQAPTLLIFKDGRKLEIGNYAIIGATLFDLTPGHSRKIALADLDLEATLKENDDRGVTFQIPSAPQAN